MAQHVFSVGQEVYVVGTACPGGSDGWPMTGETGTVVRIERGTQWGTLIVVRFVIGTFNSDDKHVEYKYIDDDKVIIPSECRTGGGRRMFL